MMHLKIRKILPLLLLLLLPLSGCIEGVPGISAFQDTVPVTTLSPPVADAAPALPPLVCRLGRGTAMFGSGWRAFQDAEFYLPHGAPSNVTLQRKGGAETAVIQGLFSADSQKIVFCPFLRAAKDGQIACFSIYALDSDWQAGIKRTFDIPRAVRGADITCAYDAAHLRSLATPD